MTTHTERIMDGKRAKLERNRQAVRIEEEEGEATVLDLDALAALAFTAHQYADGDADPLYLAGSLVAYWPGGPDHARQVAHAIRVADEEVARADDILGCDGHITGECNHTRCSYWYDACRMRDALPSLLAIRAAVEAITEAEGDDVQTVARFLPDHLADLTRRGGSRTSWRAHVGRGLSRGPRVSVSFDF